MPHLRLLSISILVLLASLAQADYHYASHTGSNTYPYASWETAADSIQAALNAASAGDTIYIGAGDYDEVLYMPRTDSLKSLIGAGMDSTFIHTDSVQTYLFTVAHKTYIKNIRFAHYWDTGFPNIYPHGGSTITIDNCLFTRGTGILIASSSAHVRNCIFDNPGYFNVGIDEYLGGDSLEVSNCLFRNLSAGEAVYGFINYATIKNNIVLNSRGQASFSLYYTPGSYNLLSNNIIQNYGRAAGFEVAIYDTASRVINNVINRTNNSSLDAAYINLPSFDFRIVNNNFTNSRRGLALAGDHQLSVHYCNFWGNTNSNMWAIDNGSFDTSLGYIHVNPMFENPDSGNFHLQAYSPLIDAGDPDILDVDGTRSDIGAYGGPFGCSYIYLDLAPQIPDSISCRVDSTITALNWKMNTEADFNRYQVFRDTFPGFSPSVFNMIAEPDTCFYQDSLINPGSSYYYRLTAVDNQGNVSDYSDEIAVRPVSIRGFDIGDNLPRYSVITNGYPNPFNNQITIVYSASNLGPQPPEIKLMIFDIQGRVVRTLVNEHKPCGTYRAIWDGNDDRGEAVASGSYIAKLSQWGMSAGDFPLKITLLK